MSRHILFLVTSHAALGSTGKKTGIWAEEFILPYYTFYDAGFTISVASPLGGVLPFDPSSLQPKGNNTPVIERFLDDTQAQHITSHAIPAETIDVVAYDAIFVPGGHGAMWDLAVNVHAINIIEDAFNQQKIIAAVCHGPAALVGAKRKDGRPIVENRRINAFTNAEEDAAGLTDVVPFPLESRLKQLGANFESTDNWQAFAIEDGLFITGQNPSSTEKVAQLVLQKLTATTEKVA